MLNINNNNKIKQVTTGWEEQGGRRIGKRCLISITLCYTEINSCVPLYSTVVKITIMYSIFIFFKKDDREDIEVYPMKH